LFQPNSLKVRLVSKVQVRASKCEKEYNFLMRMRESIGAVMVALLVLASPLPAMCGQCQFSSAKSNCHASGIQSPALPDTAPEMASEHCQHLKQHLSHELSQSLANPPSGPAFHLSSTKLCQDRPCPGLLDASAKMDRADSTLFFGTFRSAALAEGSLHQELLSQDVLQHPIGAPTLTPPANHPLSVSLRI
jgi:hypothetical protein